jgi:hypothetical protein
VVLQDVIADAMTTEVVDRVRSDGTPRPKVEVERELGLVQVLGRLALWSGILSVAGLAGWLAQIWSYGTIFLLGHGCHPKQNSSASKEKRFDFSQSGTLTSRLLSANRHAE